MVFARTLLVAALLAARVLPLLSHLMVIGTVVVLPTPMLVFPITGIVIHTIPLFPLMLSSHVNLIRNGIMSFLDVILMRRFLDALLYLHVSMDHMSNRGMILMIVMKDNLIVFDVMTTMIVMVMRQSHVVVATGATLLAAAMLAGHVLPLQSHLMVIGIMVVLPTPILVLPITGIVMRITALFLLMLSSHARRIRNGIMSFLDVIPPTKEFDSPVVPFFFALNLCGLPRTAWCHFLL